MGGGGAMMVIIWAGNANPSETQSFEFSIKERDAKAICHQIRNWIAVKGMLVWRLQIARIRDNEQNSNTFAAFTNQLQTHVASHHHYYYVLSWVIKCCSKLRFCYCVTVVVCV